MLPIITNNADGAQNKKTLVDILRFTIPACKTLDFLVGYFYFSGFEVISSEDIEKIPMRVLVGLEAECGMGNVIKEIALIFFNNDSLFTFISLYNRFFFFSSLQNLKK